MNQSNHFENQENNNTSMETLDTRIQPEQNFQWASNPTNQIYELQKENRELKQKLQERSIALALPAVIILVILINLGWFFGVRFLITPKYEESVRLNKEMKEEYESLKRKVNAIVGEE